MFKAVGIEVSGEQVLWVIKFILRNRDVLTWEEVVNALHNAWIIIYNNSDRYTPTHFVLLIMVIYILIVDDAAYDPWTDLKIAKAKAKAEAEAKAKASGQQNETQNDGIDVE